MVWSKHGARDRQAWELVRRQHGVVTRVQLEALGFSRRGIEHRSRTGRLFLISRGVYAVGRRELTPNGRWMAAVLACGENSVLSHRSAAVKGFEVDFLFPDLNLIVETDGLRYHRTPAQQARMAIRDQVHVAAGFRVLRFTHWQIAHAADEATGILRRVRAIP